jgi:hypothetical protein
MQPQCTAAAVRAANHTQQPTRHQHQQQQQQQAQQALLGCRHTLPP